ncbi:DUF371 domain-containing protein [Archaeoglobus neptunius]|uniref:DUF371 domain-containing protein n=1 Tax=Archaeoglobus neptunius TaxID=2798580 RepID=UPI001925E3FA|nr:DUF371 domain-containing protein [Archaeoglobus neptunius]
MFEIFARGHENIRATHRTTFEITRDRNLSPRGDCIIAVNADSSVADIPDGLRDLLKRGLKFQIEISLPDYGLYEIVEGYGDERLLLTHPTDIVVRKSSYICPRTLLISANKAARDLNREIVELLKDKKTEVVFRLQPLRVSAEQG